MNFATPWFRAEMAPTSHVEPVDRETAVVFRRGSARLGVPTGDADPTRSLAAAATDAATTQMKDTVPFAVSILAALSRISMPSSYFYFLLGAFFYIPSYI